MSTDSKEERPNPINMMAEWLKQRFPEAQVQMTEALKGGGWHLDLEQGGRLISIEWLPGTYLFSVSDNSVDALEGDPEQSFKKMKDAYSQVLELFLRPLKQ